MIKNDFLKIWEGKDFLDYLGFCFLKFFYNKPNLVVCDLQKND